MQKFEISIKNFELLIKITFVMNLGVDTDFFYLYLIIVIQNYKIGYQI